MKEKEFLVYFFKNLNQHLIRYSVLRNYETLPESLNGSDLDIFVQKNDVNKFYEHLKDICTKTNSKIIIKYGERTPRVCILNINFGIQIDVHEGIIPYKVYPIFPQDQLLKNSTKHNNIYVTDQDDANLIRFFKEILNNKICDEKYIISAKKSWNKKKTEYQNIFKDIFDEEYLKSIDVFFNGNIKMPIKELANRGIRSLQKKESKRIELIESFINKIYRIFQPIGYNITFLGTDGSGKSTIINAITPILKGAFHNGVYYEHMRPNVLPNIGQLFAKKKKEGPTTDPHASKPSGALGSLLRLIYYTIDYSIGYLKKVYPIKVKKSCIWIFDRYYYDYYLDPKRARINLPKFIIRLFEVFVPQPDIIICLGAEPEKIFKRKPELPLDEITRQVSNLKKFSAKKKNAFWIDTSESIETSIEQTMKVIIQNLNYTNSEL